MAEAAMAPALRWLRSCAQSDGMSAGKGRGAGEISSFQLTASNRKTRIEYEYRYTEYEYRGGDLLFRKNVLVLLLVPVLESRTGSLGTNCPLGFCVGAHRSCGRRTTGPSEVSWGLGRAPKGWDREPPAHSR